MENEFTKKKSMPSIYPVVSDLKKMPTVPMDDVSVFKDALDKCLEAFFKGSFLLVGAALQFSVASVAVCQSLAVWACRMTKERDPANGDTKASRNLEDFQHALLYSVTLLSRGFVSVHLCAGSYG